MFGNYRKIAKTISNKWFKLYSDSWKKVSSKHYIRNTIKEFGKRPSTFHETFFPYFTKE